MKNTVKESLKTDLARQEVFYSLLSSPEKYSKKKKRPKQKFLCRRMPDKLDEGHRGHHTGAM